MVITIRYERDKINYSLELIEKYKNSLYSKARVFIIRQRNIYNKEG